MSTLYPVLIVLTVVILSWPLGRYMAWAMDPLTVTGRARLVIESFFSKLLGKRLMMEQDWKRYTTCLLIFNSVMFTIAFAILALQHKLPFNPDGRGPIEPSLVFHTAASFTTNTDQQHYAGEATLSYFSQIFSLMWLQFLSAATGIAALTALARGLSGKTRIGNFFRDLLRAGVLLLLPLAFCVAILLNLGGVPMTLKGSVTATTTEGASQVICRGPVAAFVAIKQLGSNGGGFFGANSAHPFENPNFFTNFIECMAILLIPMACVWLFGRITGRMRQAGIIFLVMMTLFVTKAGLILHFEKSPPPALAGLPVTSTGNWEGKELRFGYSPTPLWGVATTATSNGSVNGMLDSFNPLSGLIPMIGMWLNVTFGGAGVGLINMFLYIIVGIFICGMMVGRTPEYMNRKVETREMKLALLALLTHPLLILGGSALFASLPWGADSAHNPGVHGFSEILYEFSSAAANNGSGFEGLTDNTLPWNLATGVVMLLARYIPIILPLAITGSLAGKKATPETSGTFRTDTLLFGLVVLGTVLLVGALLFLPVAILGPIAEHLAKPAF